MQKTAQRLGVIGTLAVIGASISPAASGEHAARKTFRFSVAEKKTIRSIPTTQIKIGVEEWPGQTFLLWMPESVAPVGGNWTVEFAHQEFTENADGGLRWEHVADAKARIIAVLIPRANSLLLEVTVKNLTDQPLEQVAVQNCFHLSSAEEFACDDFRRIHVRTDGQWRSLQQLAPNVDMPMFYRSRFLESGRIDSWGGLFKDYNQSTRVDHPMMICTSKDGTRALATASEDFQCVFHNQMPYLRCIHSQQAPIPVLKPRQDAVFRQVVYFVNGGIAECLKAFQKDFSEDRLRTSEH